jgi:hypothetical protein
MALIRLSVMFIGALVVANYVWAMVAGPRQEEQKQFPAVQSALNGREPWADREKYAGKGRDAARKSALEGLGQPYAQMCSDHGHKRLVDGLNYYYHHRVYVSREYSTAWGEPGARFIKQAWTTLDDNRVERLTREIYGRGFFAPDELSRIGRDLAAEIVRDVKVTGKPCAGQRQS